MYKQILFSFCLFTLVATQAQIASLKKSVFAGGLNEIQFVIKKYSCNEIVLTTNNGHLKKETNCWYNFIPKDTGYTVIDINIKKGNQLKKVDTLVLFVKEPTVYFFIGPTKGGFVSKSIFAKNDYARVESFDFGCSYYYPSTVDSFFVQINRNDNVIFQKWNFGNHLSNEVQSAFNKLEVNDTVLISNVNGQTPIRRRTIQSAAIYSITE
ncbi:MAG: hypothetical protein JST02_12420 [Bacteroidetes bacterium]|nr:hypothetical protein [Bacteroidota bacterium]